MKAHSFHEHSQETIHATFGAGSSDLSNKGSKDLLNQVRDLSIYMSQLEGTQRQGLVAIEELAGRLEHIEAQVFNPYRGSRAEIADRIQDLFDIGWRPTL